MKILHFSLIWICFLAFSCQPFSQKEKPHNNTFTTPELLDRNEKLYHGKEWENIQNNYVLARENLKDEKIQVENLLKLAAIFINEARVTGEHGHYYPATLKVLDEALAKAKKEDHRFLAMTMKASALLSQHQFQEALDLGKEAVQLNPYNAHIYGVLADAYVEMGDYTQAILMADKMVNIRPDLRSYARISYLREIHGDIEGAKEAMQLAVDAGYPSHEQTAWTQLTLGELHHTYGKISDAKKEYNNIFTKRENYPFALAALAEIEIEEGNFENAEALLEKAKAIIPEFSFYEQLAIIYQKTNREKDFQKIIPEILAMLEDDVKHGHNMNLEYANLYLDLLQDYDKALEHAFLEYKKRPKNIDVNRMMAKIYLAKSDYKNAAKYTTVAERTGSVHPDLLNLQQLLAKK